MGRTSTGHRIGLALALALLCLGLLAPLASAVEFKYALDPPLSLTGDCSTSAADPVPDPDCEPTYPAPPNGPSGRFDRPAGIAVDDWGNHYVASRSGDGTEGRIDIFDPEGRFIAELDDPFGPSSITVDGEGNLYVYEALAGVPEAPPIAVVRYPPTTYNPAAGEIAYDPEDRTVIASTPEISFLFNGLAIDRQDPEDPSDDRLYVAANERILIYSSAEDGNTLVDTIEPAGLNLATYIAVDAQRRLLYTTHCASKCVVWVLDADAPYTLIEEITGAETPQGKFFSTQGRLSIAADETNGHLFIGDLEAKKEAFELKDDELDGTYEFVSSFIVPGTPMTAAGVQSDVAENLKDPDPLDENEKDNYRHLYIPLPFTSGAAFAFAPPAIRPPGIEGAAAVNIGQTEAELEAQIKPGQLETAYKIEYVTQTQFEADEFASAIVAKSGTLPAVKPPQRVSALITGLTPGESYRFRISAENEVGEDEEGGAFATFDDGVLPGGCPNEVLRVGPSAALPDCRAYELVTPPGARGPIGASFEGERFSMAQASPDGNAMSFELNSGALPGTEASGYFHGDPYLATRTATGWSTELAGATGTMASKPKPGSFSPDQGFSFFTAAGTGTAVIDGKPTKYLRYPDGHSELIGRGSLGTDPYVFGKLITEGGTHVVFQTTNLGAEQIKAQKLEPGAPEEGITAVYDRTRDPLTDAEQTHVVSLLPGEVTPTQPATFTGASADGEGIAFEIENSGTEYTLYLRVRNEASYEIGANIEFAGIADGGERIFYLSGGDLEAFDAAAEETITFADTAAAVIPVNVAPQGTRAYFVSESAIGGTNPHGDSAVPGEQNLYLAEEDEGTIEISFVATVTDLDVEGLFNEGAGLRAHGLGLWTLALEKRQLALASSRLTPDGRTMAFESRANLDDYDSGGEAQVYRYDHLEGRLHCVSCPSTKTPSTEGAKLQSVSAVESSSFDGPYGYVSALRGDGERLFFESTEALVAADTDGLLDVYEWEEEGIGSCKREGGCVYLISSGQSAKADFLFGHSQSGDDVFVRTSDVLVPGNPATPAIYDARVNGGFATEPDEICVGEGCHPAPTLPPPLLVPESGANTSPGPIRQGKKCPPGKRKVKRKGKVVCIKKHKKQRRHKQQKAAANRGAAR